MTAIPMPSAEKVAREWAPQFEACDRLRDVVWAGRPTAIPRSEVRELAQRYKLVLVHLLGRALRTYRAVLALCAIGQPVEALMLCRSLFEDVIATHWASLSDNRASVMEKALRQEKLSDELLDRAWAKFSAPASPETEPEDLEEFEALKREFGGGRDSWFGNLGAAKNAVKNGLRERGFSVRTFEFFDEVVKREANMNLHSTVAGLVKSSHGSVNIGDHHHPSYGLLANVSEADMQLALLTAPACLGSIATVVFNEFEIPTERIERAVSEAQDAAIALVPSKRRRIYRRNDLCWCGSGKKLKDCHEL